MISALLNSKNLEGIGVDPYPGLGDVKDKLFTNLKKFGLTSSYRHFNSLTDLIDEGNFKFSMIHIDGEHSGRALTNDLNVSSKLIDKNGVIIIDDIFHPDFPGVTSAVFKFLHNGEFSSFLITPNKMYICHRNAFNSYHSSALRVLKNYNVGYSLGFPSGGQNGSYVQQNSINGFQQIVIKDYPNLKVDLLVSSGQGKKIVFLHKIKKISYLMFPGIINDVVRKLIRLFRK